jgi:hypothetical protein
MHRIALIVLRAVALRRATVRMAPLSDDGFKRDPERRRAEITTVPIALFLE